MGRRRKTLAEHERNGTFEKHPERKAAFVNEPKPKGPLGDPPKCFTVEGGSSEYSSNRLIEIWEELVSQAPPGVLTGSDRTHLEISCRLLLRIRTGAAKSGDFSRLESLLGKMAMNPADRPKVQVGGGAAPAKNNNGDGTAQVNTFEQLAAEDRKQTGSIN